MTILEPTWQVGAILAAASWGCHAILDSRSIDPSLREIRFALISFLLFMAGFVALVTVLTAVFSPGVELSALTTLVASLWLSLSLAAIWSLPYAPLTRVLCTMFLLLIPLLAMVATQRQRATLERDYSEYAHFLDPGASVNPRQGDLIRFAFVTPPAIMCSEKDSASCADLQRRLEDRRRLPFVALRIVFWLVSVFVVLRFYGLVIETKEKHRRRASEDYDLKAGVIAQSATVLSVGAASFISLLLAGVQFTQLGLFGGIIAAGLTVTLRDTLGNFAAGVVLLWDGSIRKGDVVTIEHSENPEVGGTYGIVEDVRLRYTLVKDRDTIHRLIPNSILINSVIENWTHDADRRVRLKVPVPVPYGSNLRQIRTVLESSCYEVARVLRSPAPKALVTGFSDSAIVVSLRFWIRDPENGIRPVISEIYTFAHERLAEIGVAIPFPQLDLHLRDVPGERGSTAKIRPALEATRQ